MADQEQGEKPFWLCPLNGRIVVELVDYAVEEVQSHLHLDTVEKPTEFGRVIAVAPTTDIEVWHPQDGVRGVGLGDVVMFGRFSGYSIQDEAYAVLRGEDLIGLALGGVVTPRRKRGEDSGLLVPQPGNRIITPSNLVGVNPDRGI